MAKIWRNRIIARTRTFDEVPMTWKNQVRMLLRLDVKNNVITAEEYEELTGEPYELTEGLV